MPKNTQKLKRVGMRQTRIPPELVKSIAEGRCVLFAGAGFSLPITGLTWNGLLRRLKEDLPDVSDSDWEGLSALDQAQLYVDERSRQSLEQLLKKAIPSQLDIWERLKEAPSAAIEIRNELVKLPFPHIFTTNYDALIELMLEKSRIPHTVMVDDDQVLVNYSPRLRKVVKVHGDLELSDTIILSQEDYLNYKRLRPGMYKLWQSQLISNTFLFYGFGLTDPNFRLLYHDLKRLLPKHQKSFRAFAFMTQESAATLEHWRNRGLHIIQSKDFPSQDKKVGVLVDRVWKHLRERESLPHLLGNLGPVNPGAEAPHEVLRKALLPLHTQLKAHAKALWKSLHVPAELRNGSQSLAMWPGHTLVDVPPRDKPIEARAQTLFHTLRQLRALDVGLAEVDGAGPAGPPTAALLGALLYRGQQWEEAIEALEEARFWYEDRVEGVPWWLARMLGRAARRARDYPTAWEFLYFCCETYGPKCENEPLALASDASLLMELTLKRIGRMRVRSRETMAKEITQNVLVAILPARKFLEGPIPEDLYGRRTTGYGNWQLGEIYLEEGFLNARPPDETLGRAMPHLSRGLLALPTGEGKRLRRRLELRLKEPFWAAVGQPLRDLLRNQ